MEMRQTDLQVCSAIRTNLESCILGKQEEIDRLLTAVLAGGHVLLEDVPGMGKTQLVKALAKSIGGQFRRIQCNPDLLPTDITGVSIYHPKQETFLFRAGPIMCHLLLADEINRATTKTQSALLEAMEEGHVTVDGETYELPRPFLLIATQNPIEFEGTYVLPEAQLDRFMMKLSLGYPSEADEQRMVSALDGGHPSDRIEQVASIDDLVRLQQLAADVHVDGTVAEYAVQIVRATRTHRAAFLGASPRAAVSLMRASRASALLRERAFVTPDDVKRMALAVLPHRIILQAEARMNGLKPDDIVLAAIQQTKVPVRLER